MPTLSKSQRLLADAREAAELRAYRTHPDVAALAIERIRTTVGVLVWSGLVLGLLFTMSNVAHFAARGADPWSVPWVIAWLLDPMVSLCLIAVLIAESTLSRYQLAAGGWVRAAKWGLLAATFAMNTWSALWQWPPMPSLVLLHAVPPAVVFVMAEAITDLRSRLTDAVIAAHRYATHALATTEPTGWPRVGDDTAVTRTVPPADRTAEPTAATADRISGAAADRSAASEDQPPAASVDRFDGSAAVQDRAAQLADRVATGGTDTQGPDVSDLLAPGRAVRDRLAGQGRSLSRRALVTELRAGGHTVSTTRANALLRALTVEALPPAAEHPTAAGSGAVTTFDAA